MMMMSFSFPSYNLHIENIEHPGVAVFLSSIPNIRDVFRLATKASFFWLYTPASAPTNVKQITLILAAFDGVAVTYGSDDHKIIRFSLDYIAKFKHDDVEERKERARKELTGVLVHEVVHCYQYDAKGSCPGGLIEGIADWVRLRDGYAPPHWRRPVYPRPKPEPKEPVPAPKPTPTPNPGDPNPNSDDKEEKDRWDAGYERTAYFLDFVENLAGTGNGDTIRHLNGMLKDEEYDSECFKACTGYTIEELWWAYTGGS